MLPLMIANAGNSERSAISSLNCPPIAAVELCREHLVFLVKFNYSHLFLCFLQLVGGSSLCDFEGKRLQRGVGCGGYLTLMINTTFCMSLLFDSTNVRNLLMHLSMQVCQGNFLFSSYFSRCSVDYEFWVLPSVN